mmetsp:Transcript_41463/g.66631  ORF Transcript_41463/g.66631 Transcript_41463/m.66631 type:complete len:1976 (+) Transcript_41463:29-5956(+)
MVPGSSKVECKTRPVRALIIVDIQNDFIDGRLAVPNGKDIIPVVNKLRMKEFDHVYVCLDWHPQNHCSFRNNNPGSELFEVLYLPNTGDAQVMWPDHCVQGSRGAEVHEDVLLEGTDHWTYAGCNPQRDSYSVFKDNGSAVLTDMCDMLLEHKVTELYAVGLATDFCVQYTVLDAKNLLQYADVYLIEDGCRGISDDGTAQAMKAFEFEKIKVIQSNGPEITAISNRKLNLNGTPRSIKLIGSHIDELYTAVMDNESGMKRRLVAFAVSSDVNKTCSWNGEPILLACCRAGNERALKLLLETAQNTLDLSVVTKRGENALILAADCRNKRSRTPMVKLLLDHAVGNFRDTLIFGQKKSDGLNALMIACRDGEMEIVEMLLSHEKSMRYLKSVSTFQKTALMYAFMRDTHSHGAIAELILQSQTNVNDRLELIRQRDTELWNCIHFGALSGGFANVDWTRALVDESHLKQLPVNSRTAAGFGLLHIVAFNGRSKVLNTLFDLAPADTQGGKMVFLKEFIIVNTLVRGSGFSELDLAVQRNHLECARLLLRLGSHAKVSPSLQELLHRLVLMGDVEACESIINYADENKIIIDKPLVMVTQRMEYTETCTFAFANYTNPVQQFVYECEFCKSKVCIVCRDRCHGENSCRAHLTKLDLEHFPNKGWEHVESSLTHCQCPRDSCCAGASLDSREKEAHTFVPNPLNTDRAFLNAGLVKLATELARNTHNVWAKAKVENGWTYAKTRDDTNKKHSDLLPYDDLTEGSQQYNLDVSVETLKVVISLGYSIEQEDKILGTSLKLVTRGKKLGRSSRHQSIVKFSNISWNMDECAPIDTSNTELSPDLKPLIELIASNSHEVWATEKIRQGWRYAPERNIKPGLKLNSSLVPYHCLDTNEKQYLLEGAEEALKAIKFFGFKISKHVNSPRQLTRAEGPAITSKWNLAFYKLKSTRQKLFNNYLFAAARLGQLNIIDLLISKHNTSQAGANLNATDEFLHTPLYGAVKRGHVNTTRKLVAYGVEVNTQDINGLTPLAISAYLGNLELCKELVLHGASILVSDNKGLTPLHHAANQGNLEVCTFLTDHLQQEFQTNRVVNLSAHSFSVDQRDDGTETIVPIVNKSTTKARLVKRGLSLSASSLPKVAPFRDDISLRKVPLDPGGDKNRGVVSEVNSFPSLSTFTPLSLAVQNNNLDVVKMFIKAGVNPMLPDGKTDSSSGCSPYERALLRHIQLSDRVKRLQDQISMLRKNEYLGMASIDPSGMQAVNDARSRIVNLYDKARYSAHSPQTGNHIVPEIPQNRARRQSIALNWRRNSNDRRNHGNQSTRELNQTLEKVRAKLNDAAKLVQLLNSSRKVRIWRNSYAMRQFILDTCPLILMMVTFGVMVQTSPDYNQHEERLWRHELRAYFETKSKDKLNSFPVFLEWIKNQFLKQSLDHYRGGNYINSYNKLLGGIKLSRTIRMGIHNPDFEVMHFTAYTVETVVIPNSDPILMHTYLENNTQGWGESNVQNNLLQLNVYNRAHDLYGNVRFSLVSTLYGEVESNIEISVFRLSYGRFPPSREFELVVCFILASLGIAWVRKRRKKISKSRPSVSQVCTTIVLFGTLVLDIYLFSIASTLQSRLASDANINSVYLDTYSMYMLLMAERRVFGIFFFFAMVPLLNAARTIPSIGPVVVALLNTMTNSAVLIYMFVVGFACFLLTLTFHVAFGTEVETWGYLGSTYNALFHTPFIETWDGMQQIAQDNWIGLILSVFYIIFATISVNLLIAVVSTVFPEQQKQSKSLWQSIITQGIENKVRDSHFGKGYSTSSLAIDYWDEGTVLAGKDGVKHWFADSSHSPWSKEDTTEPPFPTLSADPEDSTEERLVRLEGKLDQLLASLSSPSLPASVASGGVSSSQGETERAYIEERLNELLEGGSCPLHKIKSSFKETAVEWGRVKQVRRQLGILQQKTITAVKGQPEQVIRVWTRAPVDPPISPTESDHLPA